MKINNNKRNKIREAMEAHFLRNAYTFARILLLLEVT
jgi:hypothetical protein